jgi:hypothetical protein
MAFQIISMTFDIGEQTCTLGLKHPHAESGPIDVTFPFDTQNEDQEMVLADPVLKAYAVLLEELQTWL